MSRLDDALALALQLPPAERLQLVERVVSSVETEITQQTREGTQTQQSTHWGKSVIALLDQLDTTDWENMDIPDVGEWVREQRRKHADRYKDYWGDSE